MNNERLTPHQLWREQMIWKLDRLTDATREFRDAGELDAVFAHLDTHPSLSAAIAPEPVAWMWQHGETGNTGFVQHASPEELSQWERMNKPRQIVSPLYRAPPVALPALTDEWRDKSMNLAARYGCIEHLYGPSSETTMTARADLLAHLSSILAASAAPAPEQMQPRASDDTARLHYLQRTGSTLEILPGTANEARWRFRVGGLHAAVSDDLRAAIDAAAGVSAPEQMQPNAGAEQDHLIAPLAGSVYGANAAERTPNQQRLDRLQEQFKAQSKNLRGVTWAEGAQTLDVEARRGALADMLEAYMRYGGEQMYFCGDDDLLTGKELVARIARLEELVRLSRDAMDAGLLVKTPIVNDAIAAIDAALSAVPPTVKETKEKNHG